MLQLHNPLIQDIKTVLQVQSLQDILPILAEQKSKLQALPFLESFIEELCDQIFPNVERTPTFEFYLGLITEIIPVLKQIKELVANLSTFKHKIYRVLEFDKQEGLVAVVEQVKAFKAFVEFVRGKWEIDQKVSVSEVLETVISILDECNSNQKSFHFT